MSKTDHKPLPKILAPGLAWMADCLQYEYQGEMWHTLVSTYLVIGTHSTLLIDTGHPAHWGVIEPALEKALDGRTLD